MRELTMWCHRHAGWVVVAWLVVLAAAFTAGSLVGPAYKDRTSLPTSDSSRAIALLAKLPDATTGDRELLVVAADAPVTDTSVRPRVEAGMQRLRAFPHVRTVASPYTGTAVLQGNISEDARTALVAVTFDVSAFDLSTDTAREFVTAARAIGGDGLRVEVLGTLAQRAVPLDLGAAYFGLIAAGVVLLFTFGALFSMLMPLVTAAVSVGTAIAVIELLSHTFDVAQSSPEVAALLGLGVGVDYALFLITRYRQGLLDHRDPLDALAAAGATSGRSILFAGITVCIALLGMFVVGVPFLYGIAAGSSIAVLLTMIASLTLLPALLRLVGPRVLSRRERRRLRTGGRHASPSDGRLWAGWARFVTDRPVPTTLAALLVLAALAVPFFALRLGLPSAELDPRGSTTRAAYAQLTSAYGAGAAGPLQVVAEGPAAVAALTDVQQALVGRPDVASSVPPQAAKGTGIAVLTVFPSAGPDTAATAALVGDLRTTVVPTALAALPDRGPTHVYVGGATAVDVDFSQAIKDRLPTFVLAVVGISFLLLLVVFRSVAIPLTAAVMNLLAAAVAFGVITMVFQWNWGGALLGLDRGGPIEPYVPVLLFAGLFGLSMDYEVFLVGRIAEEYAILGETRPAVVRGLAATGRTVTAAAGIMVVVFAAFVFGGQRVIQEAGLGLAVAVLVDAVVIRSVLVPAVMMLLGRANWWLPTAVQRALPRMEA